MIEDCDKCINKKDSKEVKYEDLIYCPNCFLEYYDENLDESGCENFEIMK